MLDEGTKQIKHILAVLSIQFIVIDLAIIVEEKNLVLMRIILSYFKGKNFFIQHI